MQELTNKVTSIFEFDGLPETVNQNYFKMLLALTGNCSITKFDDWYAVKGQRGGTPNAYYIPENYIIANPKLGSKTIPLTDKDITVFYMTPFDECTNIGSGLYGLLNRTADSLTHVDISINTALKNSRVVALFETVSDTQQKRVDGILKKMREGEDVFAIKAPFDGELKINPFLLHNQRSVHHTGVDAHDIFAQKTDKSQLY